MSYQSGRYDRRRPPPRPRSRNRTLGCLVALIWTVLALVLGYQYFVRPRISEYVGQEIGRKIGSGPPGATAEAGGPQGGAAAAMPTVVASLPSGELRLTEDEANAYIGANPESYRPLDAVHVRFVPGAVQADIRAFGRDSTATTGLALEGGRIVSVNPQIDGPLGAVISLDDLLRPIQQQLNDELAAQGRRVTAVRVEQGVIILTVE